MSNLRVKCGCCKEDHNMLAVEIICLHCWHKLKKLLKENNLSLEDVNGYLELNIKNGEKIK